jgi:hypothetical protein
MSTRLPVKFGIKKSAELTYKRLTVLKYFARALGMKC